MYVVFVIVKLLPLFYCAHYYLMESNVYVSLLVFNKVRLDVVNESRIYNYPAVTH